jgi:hypothetical protein
LPAQAHHVQKDARRTRVFSSPSPLTTVKWGGTEGLSPDELLALIEHIAQRLHPREERKPQPLYGIWQGKFPEDADIDTTLKEVRQQWQEDFQEFDE